MGINALVRDGRNVIDAHDSISEPLGAHFALLFYLALTQPEPFLVRKDSLDKIVYHLCGTQRLLLDFPTASP
jgi:hypothetical protein